MNYFYGKPMNTLTSPEIMLLSLDIDIVLGEKNHLPKETIKMMYEMRLGLVLQCFPFGGDYSIIRFKQEMNGVYVGELEEGFVECEVLPVLPMCLN